MRRKEDKVYKVTSVWMFDRHYYKRHDEWLHTESDVTVAVGSDNWHYRIEIPDFRDRRKAAGRRSGTHSDLRMGLWGLGAHYFDSSE